MDIKTKLASVTAMLTGAGAAMGVAVATVAAPSVSAAPDQNCSEGGSAVVCQKPGHAEVYTEPPITSPGTGIGSNGPYGPRGNIPPLG